MTVYAFEVLGKPRPKGSLKCLGGRSHNMVEAVESSKPWKLHMIRTIRHDFGIEPVRNGARVIGWKRGGEPWEPEAGAVDVQVTFRFARERGVGGEVKPSFAGAWPTADEVGDTDKLCRNLGDALEQSGLIANDRNIVAWRAVKRWVWTGEQPGARVQAVIL